ncbi:MAG: nitric oxide reductase activation protein NorD, partial [bacterium]
QMKQLTKEMAKALPLSPEKLQELLRKGIELEVTNTSAAEEENFQGLFLTDVEGWKAKDGAKKLKENTKGDKPKAALLLDERTEGEKIFFYDEWDYLIKDYRSRWCFLREKKVEGGSPKFVSQILEDYSRLIKEIRRQFQMLKPERWQRIYHLERGEEIDLDALIEAAIDRQAGIANLEKIYLEKKRKERDISTLFLLDMSASTEEGVKKKGANDSGLDLAKGKKVIDIAKETLVIMAEALQEIGDEYAIFGFSGYGRMNVEFFAIKDFDEEYSAEIQSRIEGIKPQRSTRMGTAIRHAAEKIRGREAKIKNLILISDGYPQDYDYGEERGSKEYALQDTMKALQETMSKKIYPFCITIDRAGHDYLRQICLPGKYLVIEDVYALPQELPKIYRRLTT